ncbi:cytochrome c biogenesis CcdA family protein [Dactylosporangium sp. McL0621]|uniref:cytochrome c biogenesis CcdA family protein n=1 Tax=Dactylosporangium sp. McL0621 TaxID=3415678 RepID=UPI003CECA6A5
MDDVPFALAVAAGTLAALNPCGFALLPVYLTVLVAGDEHRSRTDAVARALASTAAIVTGFVAVFALFGLALTPVAGLVQARLPWFTIVLGLALAGLGAWMIAGRHVPGIRWLAVRGPAVTRTVPSMIVFGAGYALASLGCTVGPFLAIVVSSFRAGSVPAGVLLFLGYAAGMGMVVGTAALALALARVSAIGRMRRLAPVISRAGGGLVAVAGAYVAYYGWYELRILRGGSVSDPVVGAGLAVQARLSGTIAGLGVGAVVAAFAVVVLGAGAAMWWSRTRRRPQQ